MNDINKLKVGQYVASKKACIKCGSYHLQETIEMVFGKPMRVWKCLECSDYYMDVFQLQKSMYG